MMETFQLLATLYGGFFLISFIFWLYYLIVMAMMAARDAGRIPAEIYRVCEIIATIGLVYDVLYNMTIGTLVFLDIPREATLTARLIRYKRQGQGWRCAMAGYICTNLLDPFAPNGCHCKLD